MARRRRQWEVDPPTRPVPKEIQAAASRRHRPGAAPRATTEPDATEPDATDPDPAGADPAGADPATVDPATVDPTELIARIGPDDDHDGAAGRGPSGQRPTAYGLTAYGSVESGPSAAPSPSTGGDGRAGWRWLPLLAGIALWAVSLGGIDASALGTYGLLPALPLTWYAGLACLLVGATLALGAERPSGRLLGGYGCALVVVLFGTIPAISDAPQYAYVYKHIGVTRYIEVHGTVDTSIDIYHRWPGFFALAALFGSVAGEPNPVAYAAWAEPFFGVLCLLLVYALGRALLGGTRVPWLAAYLFTVANWIGQTYFAPQAIGISLGIALYVVMISQLTSLRPSRATTWLLRATSWLGGDARPTLDIRAAAPSWPRGVAVLICLLLYAALVGSHQLSPYLILLAVGVQAVLGLLRPVWLPLALAAVAVAFLIPNAEFINERFGLFSGLDPISNATGDGAAAVTLAKNAGMVLYGRAGLVLVFAMWLGAFAATILNVRRGRLRPAIVPIAVMVASALIFFAQTYGGEGRLRVYLFSLPWCALALASVLLPETRPRAGQLLRTGLALLVVAGLWLCAFFIPFDVNRVTSQEVTAAEWLYDNADPRSQIVLGDSDFPSNLSPNYPPFTSWFPVPYSLLQDDTTFRADSLGKGRDAEVAGVVTLIRKLGGSGYVVLSRGERAYSDAFGLAEPGTLEGLRAGLAADPRFELVYHNPDAVIFRMRPETG